MVKHTLFILLLLTSLHAQAPEDLNQQHRRLLGKADSSVALAAKHAQADPFRPVYHLTTIANWINDPNGPIYFNNEYHMFFQHNPYGYGWGNMSWGHAVSKDLVHWQNRPIALTPNPGSYDKDGVFSGCCVISDDGIPTILYTGVNPEVQCIAYSLDSMRTWIKYEGNPIIAGPPFPREQMTGFRDPFVWKQDGLWYMVVGAGFKDKGGSALLYRSEYLTDWQYMHPLCTGFASMWECPNFFPLGDTWVLAVSPYGDVKYTVGEYKDFKFTPGIWRDFDLGGRDGFYAPNCLMDAKGRRIMWGWIVGQGSKDYPWNGMLTLPRVLTLGENNTVRVQPLPELADLRGQHYHVNAVMVAQREHAFVSDFTGNCYEMDLTLDIRGINKFYIDLLVSAVQDSGTQIIFDYNNLTLTGGDNTHDFQLLPSENMLNLHIFVDKSVVEMYINERSVMTWRVYPKDETCNQIRMYTQDEVCSITQLDIWEMKSIY